MIELHVLVFHVNPSMDVAVCALLDCDEPTVAGGLLQGVLIYIKRSLAGVAPVEGCIRAHDPTPTLNVSMRINPQTIALRAYRPLAQGLLILSAFRERSSQVMRL